tara:strand:+ start:5039 stop:6154 length:1116 start_codon:yes stop_codon:yes gene_type:complete
MQWTPTNNPSPINIDFAPILEESTFAFLANQDYLEASKDFIANIPDTINQLVVVGMGGSFMAAKAIYEACGSERPIDFWNSIDDHTLSRKLDQINPSTYFMIISKSGTTTETHYILKNILYKLDALGLKSEKHIGIITESNNKDLHRMAIDRGLNFCEHPKEIGGRFSVFSPVAIAPCLFAGIDMATLLASAKAAAKEDSDLAAQIASYLIATQKKELYLQVLWPYSDQVITFCDWWAQLWSESLGKAENLDGKKAARISIPLVCKSSIDQHSLLQHFMEGENQNFYLFIKTAEDNLLNMQCDANREAMQSKGFKQACLELEEISEKEMGKVFQIFMMAMYACAQYYRIDPYGQPGVELGKKILKQKLQET